MFIVPQLCLNDWINFIDCTGSLYSVNFVTDIAMDWSDHALWWPVKNMWLSHPRTTLDQYGVGADAKLLFTPMHKVMKVQIPDLQILELRMDFSCKVFSAVVQLCKELGNFYLYFIVNS